MYSAVVDGGLGRLFALTTLAPGGGVNRLLRTRDSRWRSLAQLKQPYKFPRKDVPGFENSADQHFFVIHGEFKFKEPLLRENMTMSGIREFLEKHKVEGVVLHLPGNVYFKIHCGHVGLKWPLKDESANFYF